MNDICFAMLAVCGFVVALCFLYLLAVYVIPFIILLPVRAFKWVRDEIRWQRFLAGGDKVIGYKLKDNNNWLR